jgi:hydrogenase nickel incorporation protein HypA/HybF
MHEMSLAEGILRIIEEAAPREGFSRVRVVRLEVGRLAGVELSSLRFCFDAVVRDSIAEEARLEIIKVAGAGWCYDCDREVTIATLYDACPTCGGYRVQATTGLAMRLFDLEVE